MKIKNNDEVLTPAPMEGKKLIESLLLLQFLRSTREERMKIYRKTTNSIKSTADCTMQTLY